MSKLYVSPVVVMALAACASTPNESESSGVAAGAPGDPLVVLAGGPEPRASGTPVQAVNVTEFAGQTVCEDVKVTGSHIVRERRCYTRDATDPYASHRQAMVDIELQEYRRQMAEYERYERNQEAARRTMRVPR
jgi:hypothetical protein